MNPNGNSPCCSMHVLNAQGDEPVLKAGHLRSGTYPHGISCPCIPRAVPYQVSGFPGIVRSIYTRCSSSSNNNSLSANHIKLAVFNPVSKHPTDMFTIIDKISVGCLETGLNTR